MALTAIKVMDLSIHGKESSVITALLNNEAVVESKLGALSVTTAKIADSAVTTIKINDAAITTAKINDAAVTTDKVNDGAIVDSKIGAEANIAWSKMTANARIYGTAQMDGNVTIGSEKISINATSGDLTTIGDLSAVDATLSGNLGAVNATLSGDLGAVNAVLSGDLDAVNADLTGNLSAVDGTFSGALSAGSASITNNAAVGGDLTITGNLVVNGTTTTVASTEVTVADRIIHLNHSDAEDAPLPSAIAGMQVDRGRDGATERAAAGLVWDEVASEWKFALLTGESTVGDLQAVKMGNLTADAISADSLAVTGDLDAVNLDLTGDLSAVNATLTGDLSAVGATLTGDLGAVNATLSGDLSAVGGTFSGALAGDDAAFGGFVTVGETLDVTGAVTFDSTLNVGGNLEIGVAKFTVAADSGNTIIVGTLNVDGAVDFDGALDVAGAAILRDTMNVMGAVDLDSTLNVDGAVDMQSTLDVVGAVTAASFSGDLNADDLVAGTVADARLSANVVLRDTAQELSAAKTFVMAADSDLTLKAKVTGDAEDRFALQADGKLLIGSGSAAADVNLYRSAADVLKTDDKLVVGGEFNAMGAADLDSTLNVDGAATLGSTLAVAGDVNVNAGKFTVAATSGNVYALGILEVDGAAQLDSTLQVAGAATMQSTLAVTGNFAVATDKFTVASASGNVVAAGSVTAASLTTTGNAVIGGNLVVNGTMTYVNSTNAAIKDKLIHLNEAETQGANDAVPTGYTGISINRGTDASVERDHAAMVWEEAVSRFKMGMLTSDDVTLTLGDLQINALYAVNLYGNGSAITGLTAGQMAVTPAGELAATDVQAALEELQADIDSIMGGGGASLASLQTEIDNIEADLGFGVDGTMTAFADTNYINGDTVREALIALDSATDTVSDNLAAHIENGTDAHDASAISLNGAVNGQSNVQGALEDHETRLDTIEAKAWRQVVLYSATGGETSLSKNGGDPAIPAGAATQVFIDGRKVFEGASYQYTVAGDGGSISFAALTAGQSVEILYWA